VTKKAFWIDFGEVLEAVILAGGDQEGLGFRKNPTVFL
jgi:hypothetical protein